PEVRAAARVDPLVADDGEGLAGGRDEEQHAVALGRPRHAESLELAGGGRLHCVWLDLFHRLPGNVDAHLAARATLRVLDGLHDTVVFEGIEKVLRLHGCLTS